MQLIVGRCDIVVAKSLCLLAAVFHYCYPYKPTYVMDATFAEDTVTRIRGLFRTLSQHLKGGVFWGKG